MPLAASPLTIGTVSTQALLAGGGASPVQYPTNTSAAQPGAVVPRVAGTPAP